MKKTLVYYFCASVIIGCVIYLFQKAGVFLPRILKNYLNDFLIIPIVLSISLWIMQKIRNDTKYTIPLLAILYVCSMYAVIFEYFLPQFHQRYTADWYDVLLYFLGGFVFYFLQKID